MKSPLDIISGAAKDRFHPKSIRQRPTQEQDLAGNIPPLMRRDMMFALLIPILSLSACASQPIPVPEIIHEKTYIPIPVTLLAPIKVDLSGMTYGEGLGSLREGLTSCDSQLQAIGTLKPPNPPF